MFPLCALFFLSIGHCVTLRGTYCFRELVNFYYPAVEVMHCYMPNTFGGDSTALYIGGTIPNDLEFSLKTQTYPLTAGNPLYVGVFQGHNWSDNRGEKSPALKTAEWFDDGVNEGNNITTIFKNIDDNALKTFKLQEGSTAGLVAFDKYNQSKLYIIGDCRAILGTRQHTVDHDIYNKKIIRYELKNFSRYFCEGADSDGSYHVVKKSKDSDVYVNYNPADESSDEKENRESNSKKDPDYFGYTFLLRAFGHKMMRNIDGVEGNNIISPKVEECNVDDAHRYVFIGNPGCFKHTDNDIFALIIETLLERGWSLEQIGCKLLLYIWAVNSTQDKNYLREGGMALFLAKSKTVKETMEDYAAYKKDSEGCMTTSFVLCKRIKSFRLIRFCERKLS